MAIPGRTQQGLMGVPSDSVSVLPSSRIDNLSDLRQCSRQQSRPGTELRATEGVFQPVISGNVANEPSNIEMIAAYCS